MTLTAREFSFLTPHALGPDYQEVCAVARLDPTPGGYGLLHCTDDQGRHVTAATTDVVYLGLLVADKGSEALAGMELPPGKFTMRRAGWPHEWAQVAGLKDPTVWEPSE